MRELLVCALSVVALAGCSDDDCSDAGTICTVAGTGNEEDLGFPLATVHDDTTNRLYIVDGYDYVVRAFDEDGAVESVLGDGTLSDIAEGPALETGMSHATDLLLDGTGGLYVAAWHNSRVVRVDLGSGTVRRIAGKGTRASYNGDGGPAVDAAFDCPSSIAFAPNGRLFVTDQMNQVIRLVDLESESVGHYAGTCISDVNGACASPVQCPGSEKYACSLAECTSGTFCAYGFDGDTGTVDTMRLALPAGGGAYPGGRLDVGPDGTLYVADSGNGRVRAIHVNGSVETVAGGGELHGDGVPATMAKLESPTDVAVAADGTIYIADGRDHCIRRVRTDGTIDTIAGVCGQKGFDGDHGPATRALLYWPMGLSLADRDRMLYISDTSNNRIRSVRVAP